MIVEPSVQVAGIDLAGTVLPRAVLTMLGALIGLAVQNAAPATFYRVLSLLRLVPLRMFRTRVWHWKTEYLSDSDEPSCKNRRKLDSQQVAERYRQFPHLRPPEGAQIYAVEERITTFTICRRVMAWSDLGSTTRLRLFGRIRPDQFVSGYWTNYEPGTIHRGTFSIHISDRATRGTGCWSGPSSEMNPCKVRVLPWHWTRCDREGNPISDQMNTIDLPPSHFGKAWRRAISLVGKIGRRNGKKA